MSLADDCQVLVEALRRINSPFLTVQVHGPVPGYTNAWTENYFVLAGALINSHSGPAQQPRWDRQQAFEDDSRAATDMARAILDAPKAGRDHS